jgi:hypothetical protein
LNHAGSILHKERIIVSKTPSPVIFRLPQSTLIYIVLMLIIGALLLISSNIDPRASVRAQFTPTPLDPFASLRYIPWKSPDGLISLDQPQRWFAQANTASGPIAYLIMAPGSANTALFIQATPYKQLKALKDLPANPTAEDCVKALLPDQPAADIRSIQVAKLKGAALKTTLPASAADNRPQSLDEEIWAFPLDSTYVLLIQALAPSTDWPKMQGVLDRLASTFQINAEVAVSTLNQAFTTPAATEAIPVPPTITLAPTATATPTAAP